jgi:hypothetical protein
LTSVKTISLADLSYILTGLNAASTTTVISTSALNLEQPDLEQPASQQLSEFGQHNLQQGVHISDVWSDDSDAAGRTLTWHIGVV